MTYKINEDLYIGNTNKQLKDLLASGGDTLPIGSIIPYGSSTTPSNWLKCDGSAVSRTTYSELFSVIGTLYGSGDGSTTFNLPNLKGKVTIGQDTTDTDFNTIGKTGGEKTHTLNVEEMPNHGHAGWWRLVNGNGNTYVAGLSDAYDGVAGASVASNTGGSQPHNNMPPYIVTNYIIKANHTSYVGEESVVQTSYSTSTTDTYSCNYINSIIESGSNANGSWIKWADGTMLCYKREIFSGVAVQNSWGNMVESPKLNLGNFPQEFVGNYPNFFIMPWQPFFVERSYTASLTSWGAFWAVRPGGSGTTSMDVTVSCFAIGRWK